MPLLSLPNELLVLIAEHFGCPAELFSFMQTSRKLAQVVAQYQTQLLHRMAVKLGELPPLLWAARRGHTGLIRLLLDQGVSVNFYEEGESLGTALCYAIVCERRNAVAFLLDNGADLEARGLLGNTALHFAVRSKTSLENSEAIVQLLLDRGADTSCVNSDGNTPLRIAVAVGNEAVVRLLLEHGADANACGERNSAPLHHALNIDDDLESVSLAIVTMLLESGAKPIGQHQDLSIIFLAAITGLEAVVELVLEHGADVFELCNCGETALHGVVKYPFPGVVRQLIEKGIDVTIQHEYGDTALDIAVMIAWGEPERYETTVRLLLDEGGRGYPDMTLVRVLLWATKYGLADIFKQALWYGVSVSSFGKGFYIDGLTVLHVAVDSDREDMIDLALANGIDISLGEGTSSGTALHEAVEVGNTKMISLLVKKGINVNAGDDYGRTALHFALLKDRAQGIEMEKLMRSNVK